MSAPVDYKSKELNLYSNNGVGHLKFQDGKGSGLGPGFGQNQEYIFAKYTDSANGNMQWPVCIPELHTIDNSTGYVMGVSYYINDTRSKLDDEKMARQNEDFALNAQLSTLNLNITAESQTRANAISDEEKARISADEYLTTVLAAEGKIRADADTALAADIASEASSRATAVSAVDGKLTVERTRALAAEGVVQANVDAEANSRVSEIKRLDGRIDFITSNADGAAIDSLSEIVSQFSSNGQTYTNRLTYLEGIVAALVNKSQ
jgi:hypothetical protein